MFIAAVTSAHIEAYPLTFCNTIRFYGEELLAPRPILKLEEPPLVGCPQLLIQYIRSYLPYWRPFLHPQLEDAPCCGDRDPLITGEPTNWNKTSVGSYHSTLRRIPNGADFADVVSITVKSLVLNGLVRLAKFVSLYLDTTVLIRAGRVKIDSHTFLDSALDGFTEENSENLSQTANNLCRT